MAAGADAVVEAEADLADVVAIAPRGARPDVDPARLVDALPDPNLDAVDPDVAEALIAVGGESPVEVEGGWSPARPSAPRRGAR